MPFSDANRASIRVLEESVWGQTPGSGVTREVRLTASSLSATKETVVSDELRADRMVSALTEVSAASQGDINFEYSAGAQDEFLAAFVLSAWSRPQTMDFFKGKTVSVTGASVVTISGSIVTDYLTAGRRVKLSGFRNPANNGYFSIFSVATAGSDTVVTLNETSLVAEVGSFESTLYDANDVIVLNSTAIAAAAGKFTSGGANAFASARTAKQLVTGQKIFVEGLGFETGTIALSGALASADSVTVSDGTNSYTFVAGTDFTLAGTAAGDAEALAAAINDRRYAATALNVKASAATGTVTVTNLNHTGGAITEGTDGGAVVIVTNFAGGVATARGYFTITSVSDDEIGVSPSPGVVAAGAAVSVKGSLLRNPSDQAEINQRMFTIETAYNDVGQFMVQDGMVPGTFSLEIASGSTVSGTIGFQGRATRMQATSVLSDDGAYTVLGTTPGEVVNATVNIGNILKNDGTFGGFIQSLSLSGEANLRQRAGIGQKFSKGIGVGRFSLTGSMTAYFEDDALFKDFINHNTVSLSFTITDAAGASYVYTLPAMKLAQDNVAPGGIDQDILENIEFTALRDPATGCMLQIDRFSPNDAV